MKKSPAFDPLFLFPLGSVAQQKFCPNLEVTGQFLGQGHDIRTTSSIPSEYNDGSNSLTLMICIPVSWTGQYGAYNIYSTYLTGHQPTVPHSEERPQAFP